MSQAQSQEEGLTYSSSFLSCRSSVVPKSMVSHGTAAMLLDDLACMRGQLHTLFGMRSSLLSLQASPLTTGPNEVLQSEVHMLQ